MQRIISPLDGFVTPFGRRGFSPIALFAAGEQGAWLAPSDLSTLFQDDAGTTPVTAAGQSVGLGLDKSKGLVLGPELVTNGDFSSADGWTAGSGWTISGGIASWSAPTGATLTRPLNTAMTAGRFYRVTLDLNYVSGSGVQVGFNGGGGIDNGPVLAAGATQRSFVVLATLNRTGISIVGIGGSVLSLDNISVRELPGNHATQAVFAARPIYRVSSGIPHIEDDLVDDSLNWTAPAGNYTVAWCDTAGNVTIQTAQALSGATDALRTQRMVGYLAINRALTAAETASLTAWFKAKAGV